MSDELGHQWGIPVAGGVCYGIGNLAFWGLLRCKNGGDFRETN